MDSPHDLVGALTSAAAGSRGLRRPLVSTGSGIVSGRWTKNVAPTVGVEEEFLLLDPRTGSVAAVAPEVIALAAAPRVVTSEVMRFMVETRTPVCRNLDEVRAGLLGARRRLAWAADVHDVLSVAVGIPPRGLPHDAIGPFVTAAPRYAELLRRFPDLTRTSGTCSCHVHVGVANRRLGLQVLLRIRPWLPALLALTAASPVWEGRDSGWASRRFPLVARWPTVRPPPTVSSVEEYDARVRAAVSAGLALDERSVYYLARLSPRYPTVEVRVADVCLTVDHAVAYAGLVEPHESALVRRHISAVASIAPSSNDGSAPT